MNVKSWVVDLAVAMGKDIGTERLKLYERDLSRLSLSDGEWDVLGARCRDNFDRYFPQISEIKAMAKVIALERKASGMRWETFRDERGYCMARPTNDPEPAGRICTTEEGIRIFREGFFKHGGKADSPLGMLLLAAMRAEDEVYDDEQVPF